MTDVSVRRVRRLLSGASTIAIVAALGNTTALAAGQFFGPGNVTPIVISADTDFVNVTNATVAADGAGSAFVINTGVTIDNTGGSALVFQNSTFLGSVTNNGSVISAHGIGWQVSNDLVIGDLDNNGYVHGGGSGEGDGLAIADTVITGSIRNTGSFIGDAKGANGVTIGGSSVAGEIINSGHMTGGDGLEANGLEIDDSTVSGAIRNQSGGVMSGGTSSGSNVGLRIANGTFVGGGIFNDGSIGSSDFGSNRDGIYIDNSTVAGGIHNSEDAVISGGEGYAGIEITNGSTVTGGIANDGRISATGDGNGIYVSNASVAGLISNTGSISSLNAISLNNASIADGLFNDGTLTGDRDGVFINGGLFSKGIVNNGSIVGGVTVVGGDGFALTGAGVFTGGITNSGLVKGYTAVDLDTGTTFSGGITNNASGSIVGTNAGAIRMTGGGTSVFSGGIANHGWITSTTGDVMVMSGVIFSGGIHNYDGGSIQANGASNAIHITSTTTFGGGLLNEGRITVGSGQAIRVDTTKFTGKLDNAGFISSGGIAILDEGFIADGIWNSGTIQAPAAINIALAGTGQNITQTGGAILGDIVFSTLGQSYFVGKGGYFKGAMFGNAGNDDVTVVSGTWSAEGSATGMGAIRVLSGTGVFGGKFYGDLEGTGFIYDSSDEFGTGAGKAFIDDDTHFSIGDVLLGGEGSLEFLLTSKTAVHGSVTAELVGDLNGRLATYLDWNSFAGLGAAKDFGYDSVIQSSNNLNGAFLNEDDVDTNSVFFEATATRPDAKTVDIDVHRVGFDEIVTAPSNNQKAVGDALEHIFAAGGTPFLALEDPNGDGLQNPQETNEGLYSALFQLATTGDVADAYASLDGHVNAAIFQTTFTINDLLDRNIQSRLEDVRDTAAGTRTAGDPARYATAAIVATDAVGAANALGGRSGWSAWARAFGSWGDADGDTFNEGFNQDSNGFGMGVDYATNGGTLLGLAGQFATTEIEFDRAAWSPIRAKSEIDSGQIALYGYHSFGTLFVDGNASATFNSYDTRRVDFWGQPIFSNYDSTVYSVYGELGADLDAGRFNIQPYAGLGFRHADFDNFTETCPLFCLAIAPDDAESLASALGVRATATYHWGHTPISPEFRVAWQHEFDDDRGAFDAAFVGAPGSPFHVEGHSFADDKIVVGAGISAEVTHNFVLFADYNGSFSSDFDAHSISGGVRVTW